MYTKTAIIISLSLITFSNSITAQIISDNTKEKELKHLKDFDHKSKKETSLNKIIKRTAIPGILIGTGLASWSKRKDIKSARDKYYPNYRNKIDDYLQYSPTLAVYGLNAVGIKGKHDIKRFTATFAASCLTTAVLVNGIKYSTRQMRPDGSKRNSFPSGHTTTAFMNATMLHKEYGHRNKLYSILGYSSAACVGTMRVLNNKHWVSDVLVGAGLGILSAEFAYALSESFFNNKGKNNIEYRYSGKENPSFFSIRTSYLKNTKRLINSSSGLNTKAGFSTGIEAAYFWNHKFGIGGQLGVSAFELKSDLKSIETKEASFVNFNPESLGFTYLLAGPYVNLKLSPKTSIMGNLALGMSFGAEGNIKSDAIIKESNRVIQSIDFVEFKPHNGFAWSAGLKLRRAINNQIGIEIHTNYTDNRPSMRTYTKSRALSISEELKKSSSHRLNLSNIGLGIGLSVRF
ncbi:MAG: phosphatase PAP2 family protein [Marinifilaceae bacterium]|jgi:membrane-associated phospholipid phosphatase|nr:phosphatase PAP2 family protein [Marinifilaceae bacterium]